MTDWTPKPEESGSLGPPRRYPPTAVGVATPPPPRGRGSRRFTQESRLRHLTLATLGFLTVSGSGLTLGAFLPTAVSVTVAIGLVAALVTLQVRRNAWRRRRPAAQLPLRRAA